jgi:hypothetical protein
MRRAAARLRTKVHKLGKARLDIAALGVKKGVVIDLAVDARRRYRCPIKLLEPMFRFGSELASAIALVGFATIAHAGEFWSDFKTCMNADLEGVTTTRYEAIHKQRVHGVAKYTGDDPIRDVKVCGGGSCTVIFAGVAMQKGEKSGILVDRR